MNKSNKRAPGHTPGPQKARPMSETNKYQGWANMQTWAVAGFLNNSKVYQDRALDVCRDINAGFCPGMLQVMVDNLQNEIVAFADWAWPDGYNCEQVDWIELAEHFKQKIKEGC